MNSIFLIHNNYYFNNNDVITLNTNIPSFNINYFLNMQKYHNISKQNNEYLEIKPYNVTTNLKKRKYIKLY